MNVAILALYILAAVCFLIASRAPSAAGVNWVAVGLLAWVLVPLTHYAQR